MTRMADLKTKNCHCCDGSGKELDSRAVGAAMKAIRESRGISQTEVARRMKLSKPYICDLERGHRHWRDELIASYNKALK